MAYNKYYVYKRQVSTDNGQTWTDVYPLETKPYGSPIGTYDTLAECEGLFKFRAEYSDSTTYSAACNNSTELTSTETKAHSTSYTAMTTAEIGDCVTAIGYLAFNACYSLTSIDIPDSVTSISNLAFYYCSGLTSCTIGSGVTNIGASAFEGCSGLTSITVNATTPPTLSYGAFNNTNNCPIYVPSQSVNAYKTAEVWSTHASRIQAIP